AGFTWLNFEDENIIDIGAGVGKGFSHRSPRAIVNEFVNSHKSIKKEKNSVGAGKIITRRPITLVWYGFLLCGEAAAQINPTTGYGVTLAMKAAKIAAEVIIEALRRKEVSIQRLWEYQVKFTKEYGRDLAALDMLRKQFLLFSEEELSYLMKRGILSRKDFEKIIHARYPKITIFRQLLAFFTCLTRLKLLWRAQRAVSRANKVYKQYKKLPKEYDTRKYHFWLLEQLSLFREIGKKG
ncbi:MAG: NAD(P)/FAD-dependent oxidoreductase, partial [Candidatus Heimdallarchaeaceae archaeon]